MLRDSWYDSLTARPICRRCLQKTSCRTRCVWVPSTIRSINVQVSFCDVSVTRALEQRSCVLLVALHGTSEGCAYKDIHSWDTRLRHILKCPREPVPLGNTVLGIWVRGRKSNLGCHREETDFHYRFYLFCFAILFFLIFILLRMSKNKS